MAKPCIMSLTSESGIVSDTQEMTASLIRYVLLNPGFTSTIFSSEMVSFRTIAAQYGHNRDALCAALEGIITRMLKRYFPDYDIMANFTTEDYDLVETNDPRYAVLFDITYRTPDGTIIPGIGTYTLTVSEKGQIEFHYNNTALLLS